LFMGWNAKTFGGLAAAAIAAMIALGFANHALNHDQPSTPLLVAFFGCFLSFVYALVPLMVHAVLGAQRKLGNAEREPVRWASAHEKGISFAFWGLFSAGALIAIPAMLLDLGASLAAGDSAGTLRAGLGMTVDEVRAQSSLPIDAKTCKPGKSCKVVG